MIFKTGVLAGGRGKVLRVSRKTGGLSVELIEDKGAYRKGEYVHVQPYDVQSATETR